MLTKRKNKIWIVLLLIAVIKKTIIAKSKKLQWHISWNSFANSLKRFAKPQNICFQIWSLQTHFKTHCKKGCVIFMFAKLFWTRGKSLGLFIVTSCASLPFWEVFSLHCSIYSANKQTKNNYNLGITNVKPQSQKVIRNGLLVGVWTSST